MVRGAAVNHFEIYLLKRDEGALDAPRILQAVLSSGAIHPYQGDTGQAVYKNPDTGVFFSFVLSPEVASLWRSRLKAEASGELGEGGESEEDEESFGEEEDEVEEGEEGEEEEGEAPFDVEMTPVAINVPLLSPSFFCWEAIAFAERVAGAADLRIDHTVPEDAGGGDGAHEAPSPQSVFSAWDRGRRELVRAALEQGPAGEPARSQGSCSSRKLPVGAENLAFWSPEKAEGWWRYGISRGALLRDLEADGVHVPLLQAAFHDGEVKTLCDFRIGAPAVLPRTDLVLVRRERERKGIFRAKKVLEEGIVPGEKVWTILSAASEYRKEPCEILIFLKASSPPAAVAERLEGLYLEPLESARRNFLLGVVDLKREDFPGAVP